MRNLLAALLFSTAVLACTKTADPTPAPTAADPAPVAAAPAPAAAADPTPAPAAAAPAQPAMVAEAAPDLVEAAPDVQVVADYDTPVFFNGGMYWRFNDNHWYSSSVYTGGWTYNASPPSAIVHVDRPERFVHYKPSGYVARRRPAPQREWHPEPIRAEVRVDPHAEVHVAVPRVEVHAPRVEVQAPRVEVQAPRVEVQAPRVDVRVPRVEVRVPSVDVHVH